MHDINIPVPTEGEVCRRVTTLVDMTENVDLKKIIRSDVEEESDRNAANMAAGASARDTARTINGAVDKIPCSSGGLCSDTTNMCIAEPDSELLAS